VASALRPGELGLCLSVQDVRVKPPERVEVVDVGRVRAGAQAYLGPRPGVGYPVGDMMVYGVLFPLGEAFAAAQSLQAVHANVAAAQCREPAAVHR
jgi:hypothetical protein